MSTSSNATHEIQLAIYDLSQGMARSLSAQFLGPQHAVEIIPHTAIIAYGKEYFFGQGIEWCSPQEFRASRGIHPIEIQPLGHTTCTEQEFESWCRAQAANGRFGMQSYDLITRNCNNFSEEAAREGLRLQKSVPQWILDVPQKFLSSPMGMMVRPLLEQMQINNTAPTNVPAGSNAGSANFSQPAFAPTSSAPAPVEAANPWENIAPATQPPSASAKSAITNPGTPLLDKQTALLSTDTGVVKICMDRLKPKQQEQCDLLSKLADTKATWIQDEINSIHQYLRSVIVNDTQHMSYALMLLRLVVLKQPVNAAEGIVSSNEELSQSTQLVANLLFGENLTSLTNRSMAWCVLSNAMGSTGAGSYKLTQLIDRALSDSDPLKDGASTTSQTSLRQSASAFLYNSSRYLTIGNEDMSDAADNENTELSEGKMSILLGCFEHLHEETDGTTMQRLFMAIGQLLKSRTSGKAAVSLVKDLGLVDEEIGKSKNKEVEGLAKEVASLLA